jgi:hypothetical protein
MVPVLTRRPTEAASAEEMDMKVEHRLTCVGADVDYGPVATLQTSLTGNLGGGEVAVADDLRITGLGFFETGEVALGDDQHVGRSLRVNVLKGNDLVVLIYLFGGNFTRDDLAEQAISHGGIV